MDPLVPGSNDPLAQRIHDALGAVRSRGAYYGGWPQVPGPAMRLPAMEPPAIGWNSVEPVMRGGPAPAAGNENLPGPRFSARFGSDDRAAVLDKLMANRDFRPSMHGGKLWWRSLSPAENKVMQRIGWARAPDVEYADEISDDPLTSLRAWERNIRHWQSLSSPK